MKLFDKIETVISTLNVETISKERKTVLQPLVDFLNEKAKNEEEIRINFICTHN